MRRFLVSVVFLAAGVSLTLARGQSAQTPPEREQPAVTFKVEVNYVEVDAIVTDARGNLVRTLTRDDFEVIENGTPQPISVFSLVDIPVERAERPLHRATAVEPDVRSNAKDFDGRIFVIVLDDLHTNPLRSALVKVAAKQFLEQSVGANDVAAVLHTSGRTDASQDFTSSRRLLTNAIDKFVGRKVRSATLGMIEEYYRTRDSPVAGDKITDPDDFERGYQAQSMLRTIKSLAEWLGGIRGRRKSVVLFSEGIDYDIANWIDNRSASSIIEDTRQAVGAATRNNVNIYGVDPRGLTALGDEVIEIQSPPRDMPELSGTGLLNDLRRAQDSLRVLADETGGFAAVNSNDFASAFSRILEENSTYYVLGYYPTNDRRDGRFRRLQVRVKKPGYEVRARKGYVAPRGRPDRTPTEAAGGTSAALREALESPLPVSGLTLSAFAAPFRGADTDASVLVSIEVPGAEFAFAEQNGRFVDALEMSVVVYDHSGKAQDGTRNSVKLDLRPQTHVVLLQRGVRITSRVSIPPGRYQLRIAAREENAGRVGSLIYDLVVPDFSENPLVMSGLALTSLGAAQTLTPGEDEEMKKVMPGQPTTQRDFEASDTLALFVEVYDNRPTTPHAVDITTQVLTDEGREVFRAEDVRKSEELGGVPGGYGYTARVPLTEFSPGLYVLRVEARSRLGGDAALREVQFRVSAPRAGG